MDSATLLLVLLIGCHADSADTATPPYEGDDVGECSDGADNDRDGAFDCMDPDCQGAPVCQESDADADADSDTDSDTDSDSDSDADADADSDPNDQDGDGYPSWEDCDDENSSIHPGAREVTWDGVDDDCDGHDLQLPYIAAGNSVTCMVNVDGEISCWGNDAYNSHLSPSGSSWRTISIDSAGGAACALDSSGRANCWGCTGPQCVPPTALFDTIDVGTNHACGVYTGWDTVACWGTGYYGETASGTGSCFVEVSAGLFATCAIDSVGAMSCWGYGSAVDNMPAGSWANVSVGYYMACAVDTAGSVGCWGGEDSVGTVIASTPSGGTYSYVETSSNIACALTSARHIRCWGSLPTTLSDGYVQLSVGAQHVCAVRDDMEVVCFGSNDYGECDVP